MALSSAVCNPDALRHLRRLLDNAHREESLRVDFKPSETSYVTC
jgi:hypothetical protein